MQENQGFREFERGFLYQIYDRKLRIWGCDMFGLKNLNIIVYRQILKCKRGEFSLKEKEWGA